MARVLRSGRNLLHGIHSRSREAHAWRNQRGNEVFLPHLDHGTIKGTIAATDRVLQAKLQEVKLPNCSRWFNSLAVFTFLGNSPTLPLSRSSPQRTLTRRNRQRRDTRDWPAAQHCRFRGSAGLRHPSRHRQPYHRVFHIRSYTNLPLRGFHPLSRGKLASPEARTEDL